jgi:hypothetical protein
MWSVALKVTFDPTARTGKTISQIKCTVPEELEKVCIFKMGIPLPTWFLSPFCF